MFTLPGFCCPFGLFHRFWGFLVFVAAFCRKLKSPQNDKTGQMDNRNQAR